MQIDRRQLAFPVLALGLLSAVPAFAGADEDAIAKNLEAFRAAQAAGNTEVIASICAEELSYSHSNAKIDTASSGNRRSGRLGHALGSAAGWRA